MVTRFEGPVSPAAHHAILIRKAITEARAAGVNVNLEWDEDEDGIHVSLTTSMEIVDGPFFVEGY